MTDFNESTNLDERVTQPRAVVSSTITWVVASMAATAAVSLVAAHAPARVRLIGLFSIAFGLLIGWVTVFVTSQCGVRPPRRALILVAAGLAFCGLAGSTWETYRIEAARRAKLDKEEFAARLFEEFDKRMKVDEGVSANRPRLSSFQRYLNRRVRQMGDWPSPWPECFWFTELVAAAVASAWISNRL